QVRRRLGGRLVEGAADLQELVVVHGRLRVGPTPLSPTGGRHASLPRATAAPRMYPFRKAANGTRAIDRGGANGQSSSRHRPAQGGSEEAPHALAHPTPEVKNGRDRQDETGSEELFFLILFHPVDPVQFLLRHLPPRPPTPHS